MHAREFVLIVCFRKEDCLWRLSNEGVRLICPRRLQVWVRLAVLAAAAVVQVRIFHAATVVYSEPWIEWHATRVVSKEPCAGTRMCCALHARAHTHALCSLQHSRTHPPTAPLSRSRTRPLLAVGVQGGVAGVAGGGHSPSVASSPSGACRCSAAVLS